MKRLLALLLLLPALVFAGGAHIASGRFAPQGKNYDRLPANFQFFVGTSGFADGCTGGDGQVGETSINTAGYGGSSTGNLWAQPYVQGLEMRVRWVCLETSQGVYADTTLNTMIDQAAAHAGGTAGGQFVLALYTRSYQGASTHSNIPSYIYSGSTSTYGGTSGHAGEVLNASGSPGPYSVIFGNANVFARWQALIDHLASSYGPNSSRPAAAIYLDEPETGNAWITPVSVGYANVTALVSGQESMLQYCITAFYPTPCFMKFNYLTGDTTYPYPYVTGMVNDCLNSTGNFTGHCNFAQELAMPKPYDAKFPQPAGSTISDNIITDLAGTSKSFSASSPRLWNTDYATSSTYDSAYNPNDCLTFLRYMASLSGPYVNSSTKVFYLLIATNGINTSSGAWYCWNKLITNGVMR